MTQAVTLWLTGPDDQARGAYLQALLPVLMRAHPRLEVLNEGILRQGLQALEAWPELVLARRLSWLSLLLARQGVLVVVEGVFAQRKARDLARLEVGELVEIYVEGPPVEGYAAPLQPELWVRPGESLPEAAVRTRDFLVSLEYLREGEAGEEGYSPAQEEEVRRRLAALGYV